MNDRLKSRAWDKEKQVMLYPKEYEFGAVITENDFAINSDGTVLGFMYAGRIQKRSNLIIMLCTGLKDKNGELIFEGDILKNEYGIFEVFYRLEYGGWYIRSVDGHIEFLAGFLGNRHTDEIIGNIYESSTLLKL